MRSRVGFLALVVLAASMMMIASRSVSLMASGRDRAITQGRTLITQKIDESILVTLRGNTRPEANAQNDRGPVADGYQMEHMFLQLRRSPEQEKALERFINGLHDPKSPNFHQWISAEEFGQRFGHSQEDIAKITHWLESHGFTVHTVYPNSVIDFSGSASSVREAFHTAIHDLDVEGKHHIANIGDPQIPAALAPAVVGVVSMHDFKPHSMYRPRAQFTLGAGTQAVVPGDLATIYNLNPLFAHGISGQGQTVVVVEDTNVYSTGDWNIFRKTFGLAKTFPKGSFKQVHPKPGTGGNCGNPGVNGDDAEAILDAEWASAAAPNAAIVLASCADTNANFGGFIALQNLLTNGIPPAIVSISYGLPESVLGAAFNAYINALYQLAVTEGVSVFVASGDQGAAVSDRGQQVAFHGINISGFASTPYNVAVGGTDYEDSYLTNFNNGAYWSSTNGPNYNSALSYIPEIPWNDSCASVLAATFVRGPGEVTYGLGGFCNDSFGQNFLDTTAGTGGPSGCATGAPSTFAVVSGTCAGYAKPSWQSVFGNPSDGVRDVPDVSLFAANGFWGHYYVICYSDPNFGGSPCLGTPDTWAGGGGTSFSSPIMAGIQALVNQHTASRQGNPNSTYYSLANAEYGLTGNAACDSSASGGPSSSCTFYDVTQGDMDLPCYWFEPGNPSSPLYNCYAPDSTSTNNVVGVLSTSNSSYQPAYGTTTGWDFATGIGTVNACNLVENWPLPTAAAAPEAIEPMCGLPVTTPAK